MESLEGEHGAVGGLAVTDAALAADLDDKDFLLVVIVLYDLHVAELDALHFVRPQAGIGHEQNEVMQLFGFPAPTLLLGVLRALSRGRIELLVLLGREPGAVRNLGSLAV